MKTDSMERSNEWQAKEAALNEQLTIVRSNLVDKSNELTDYERKLEEIENERKQSASIAKELEERTEAWKEEKRVLLEKCLNVESDLEFERERALENKRRFDDALSAMHELGRANQSLQIDISKQFHRKWLDDSEAVNCTFCGRQFALTVRKHHCRHCGFIFCNECSSKTAQVPSCRRPARVCNNCHAELAAR